MSAQPDVRKSWDGGPPGPRPGPGPACSGFEKLESPREGRVQGTRADRGVRPTICVDICRSDNCA